MRAKRIAVAALAVSALNNFAEARQAHCVIPFSRIVDRKILEFDIDVDKPPYLTKVNGEDEGSTDRRWIELMPFDSATARSETWYMGPVSLIPRHDPRQSIVRMQFGESVQHVFQPIEDIMFFIDWSIGKASWLNVGGAFDPFDAVTDRPQFVIQPVKCERLD
jgi:hypothetical protein